MIITREQAHLLADLAGQIKDKYGLIVTYINPALSMYASNNADFIIYESGERGLFCFYKDDIRTQNISGTLVKVLPDEPEFDDKVETLFERINNDLLEGAIWIDPGFIKEVDGVEVNVTKRKLPDDREVFETNIYSETYGVVYPYEYIELQAPLDKRFAILKDVIDENWPRPPKPVTPPSYTDLINHLLKYFGF